MTISKTNVITGHELTLMTPIPERPSVFGWIRLLNNTKSAGFIYLQATPIKPRLSHDDSYIVSSMPMSELYVLLNVLKNESNLTIRYEDPQMDGGIVTVFIESAANALADVDPTIRLPDEIRQEILRLRVN